MTESHALIRHKQCGGVMGRYLGGLPEKGDYIRVSKWERLDGSHPEAGRGVREVCRHCHNDVNNIRDVEFVEQS